MLDLLKHPQGFIENRILRGENYFSLVHSDRSLFLGIVTGFLVVGYTFRAIDDFGTIFLNSPGDSSIFSSVLSLVSVIVFFGLFLRLMVFSRKLLIEGGSLFLFDHWPFAFPKSVVVLSEIENISITTLFSHLSRKATVFISIRTLAKGNLKQVYSCQRRHLNDLVKQMEGSLKANELQVTVNNENTLQN